jgi:hypothetical protein
LVELSNFVDLCYNIYDYMMSCGLLGIDEELGHWVGI